MRCIEMLLLYILLLQMLRLTLTWDVLKYFSVADTEIGAMRLTLTWDVLKFEFLNTVHISRRININMRCIEIIKTAEREFDRTWLTLTWDVLKLIQLGKYYFDTRD